MKFDRDAAPLAVLHAVERQPLHALLRRISNATSTLLQSNMEAQTRPNKDYCALEEGYAGLQNHLPLILPPLPTHPPLISNTPHCCIIIVHWEYLVRGRGLLGRSSRYSSNSRGASLRMCSWTKTIVPL